MKLHERLSLGPNMWTSTSKLESVEIAKRVNPNATPYARAWKKFELPDCRHHLALACYYSDEYGLVKEHANQCILELEEFFFGDWRHTFQTPDKAVDPNWWKRRFIWMQAFEAATLWGSVLGKWDFLKRIGRFPEPDSCVSDGYRAADRDFYVAWGTFLHGASSSEMEPLLERLRSGKSRSCRLVVALLRAGLAHDAAALQTALEAWLKYYRKEEFPKEKVAKKITIEGTFFVRWAEKERLVVNVPPEVRDHIVRLQDK